MKWSPKVWATLPLTVTRLLPSIAEIKDGLIGERLMLGRFTFIAPASTAAPGDGDGACHPEGGVRRKRLITDGIGLTPR